MDLNTYYKKHNETDASFAFKANLTQSTLWRIRNLEVVPRADTALKIVKAAKNKVTIEELLYPDNTQ